MVFQETGPSTCFGHTASDQLFTAADFFSYMTTTSIETDQINGLPEM